MKIPYDEFELRLALFGVFTNKGITEEKLESVVNEIPDAPKDKATLNKTVAEENGISVIELINSPNYQLLISQYHDRRLEKAVLRAQESLGITHVQAWALFAWAMELLG